MCGINGIILNKREDEIAIKHIMATMNNSIIHRGPDQEGNYFCNQLDYTVAMGMRRLSIIDLHTGEQPMHSQNNMYSIVFNGEIYNYKTLRYHLEKKGYTFTTQSDTEVVLKLYEVYGKDSFKMLDGMFAISIHDKLKHKIIIARDFFGEKPLYYFLDNNLFYWASELKSIINILQYKPSLSKIALNLYFQLTYIPAPYTIYENIYKLEPNSCLEFDLENFTYSLHLIEQDFEKIAIENKKQATIKTKEMVQESVSSRSIADVKVGTFLSGGVDSSIVSLCLAQQSNTKIDTFSIGFDKKSFDETNKSKLVSKLINSNHHEFILNENDLIKNLDQIILNFDEPFADSSALPSFVVSNKTAKHVKVALTGDGGDEVFGGYNKYYMGRLNEKYTHLIPSKWHSKFLNFTNILLSTKDDNRGMRFKIKKAINAINYDEDFYYNIISLGFSEKELKNMIKEPLFYSNVLDYYRKKGSAKTISDFRQIDRMLSLEGDMLVKVDRTSMLNSIECRAPFLNKKLWNFSNHLPENFLINKWDKKYILKEAFKEYFPDNFLNKSKKGFGVPVGDWLRTSLKDELLMLSDKKFIEEQNIFNYNQIVPLIHNHINNKVDNTFRVWTYYCFQKWYKFLYS
ncbi:asparagine synthase (glutamine-hydrolyzing) [Flavobacterium croceum]|uniref:asparagine synthase (glutamine-hydrolyzing) n=1 Tax=Flavobacterium croceum TaxID=370975 RepID=UPI0024A9CC30|nr:asparagine synthase (glutamine-hydrolyzing) [Flavobacterium croceum]